MTKRGYRIWDLRKDIGYGILDMGYGILGRISDMGYGKLTKVEKKVNKTASFSVFRGLILYEVRGFGSLEMGKGLGSGYLRHV